MIAKQLDEACRTICIQMLRYFNAGDEIKRAEVAVEIGEINRRKMRVINQQG
jgi:hypothetical protein